MSLSEFLRMARGKVESEEQKPTNCSADLSSLHENDLAELVWNDGQVMMQGQSNRATKNPTFDQFPSAASGMQDNRCFGNTGNLKAGKFGDVQSLMDDAVSSAEILNQDNDIEPWLNSSDGCAEAYFSDLLPEISGVTANEPSLNGSFALMNKRNGDGNFGHSQNVPMNIRVNSELQNSSSNGLFNPYETNQVELSRINSSAQNSHVFGNSNQGQTSENTFMSMLPEKHSIGISGSGPQRVLNFTNFKRPVSMHRSNLHKSDGLDVSCSSAAKSTQNKEKVFAINSFLPVKNTFFQPLIARKVKPCSDEPPDSVCPEDSIKNDKLHSSDADAAKGFTVADKVAEPLLAASSVCSGNSAELASNDQTHKRKDRDNDESESRSEDNEEESVGRKKVAPARGVSGSKRSRAAEVHNLSERRRRDRINEKMRALQELIPNCNKADKASMLDEAIEYLKSLQLQVQVLSMGAGFCMSPMMFPTALPHMPHFPQVSGAMGYGMGGMLDMNSRVSRFPVFPMSTMQGARFSSPPMYGPTTYQGLAGHNFPFYGVPAQGFPVSAPRAPPLVPSSSGLPSASSTVISNTQQVVGIHVDAPKTSLSEAANGAFDNPLSIQKDNQVQNSCDTASVNLNNMKDDISSKEGSH